MVAPTTTVDTPVLLGAITVPVLSPRLAFFFLFFYLFFCFLFFFFCWKGGKRKGVGGKGGKGIGLFVLFCLWFC